MSSLTVKVKESQQRSALWSKYNQALNRGHKNYTYKAKYLENMYLGGGKQWEATEDDTSKKNELDAAGKPVLELNLINSSIRTIKGYQTQSRMNIAYQPREFGDLKTAEVLTKIALYELDRNKFPWVESQVFEDGLIQQRGYFSINMDYEEDLNGAIKIEDLDPLNVIPDPDAKSYNPKDWNYVIETKWLPLDTIKALYPKKYKELYMNVTAAESDWGTGGFDGAERNKFSEPYSDISHYKTEAGDIYVRILEFQHIKVVRRDFYYDIENDVLTPVPDNISKRNAKKYASANNFEIVSRVSKRIRYTIISRDTTLHDDWSPYDHFTIVPYFPIFRRGITLGLVDNLTSNQDMMNKVYSQILHIVNTTANSGWIVEENSLTNMDIEDLEQEGAATGLVIEHKRASKEPRKIEPNQIPTGLKDIFNTSRGLHDQILGITEAFRGESTNEVSGQAIQQRVAQTGIGLTSVIDNLFYTRNLVAEILLNLIQNFYTEERVFRIVSDMEIEEEDQEEELTINQEVREYDEETGEVVTNILNDVTVGKYDIVISDVPTQVTYLNAQFQQGLDLRKFGIQVPDDEMIMMSTLTRRNEIAKKVRGEANKEQEKALQAQMEQLRAEVDNLKAESQNTSQDTIKKAAEVANMIAENPNISPLIENMLGLNSVINKKTQTMPEEVVQQQPGLGNF